MSGSKGVLLDRDGSKIRTQRLNVYMEQERDADRTGTPMVTQGMYSCMREKHNLSKEHGKVGR